MAGHIRCGTRLAVAGRVSSCGGHGPGSEYCLSWRERWTVVRSSGPLGGYAWLPSTGTEIASEKRVPGPVVVSRGKRGKSLATEQVPGQGKIRLSRFRDNARISAFPVDLTKLGASLMKIRMSVLACVVGFLFAVAFCSPAEARNDQEANIAFEGDPGGGFLGVPGGSAVSGSSPESQYPPAPQTADRRYNTWVRFIASKYPLVRFSLGWLGIDCLDEGSSHHRNCTDDRERK